MKIISFLSQKGGVAKSTLSRAIATQAQKEGLMVKLADLDVQQATTVEWHQDRLLAGYDPVGSVELFRVAESVKKIVGDYDLVVVDGPPRASVGTLELAQISDLIVLPTCTSKDDLRPSIRLAIELVDKNIPKNNIVFAIVRASKEAEVNAAKTAIADAGFNSLDGFLYERPLYRITQDKGLAITEVNHKGLRAKAAVLVDSLADILMQNI